MKGILFAAGLWAYAGIAVAQGSSSSDLPAHDVDFACTSRADADRYVREFHIDLRTFGGLELCNGNVDSKKLFNDLMLIENGQFSGQVKKNLFIQDFIQPSEYYSYMKAMTRSVRRGHDIPYATAYNQWGNFTMQDGWTKLSALGRVGTFIHEARHTDGYGHTGCSQGPYKDAGMAGCDGSLDEGGSHGVEMEYYSRVVLQGQNFHPVYKQMARLMNLGRANFVFNRLPMHKTAGLVALTDSALLIDSGNGKVAKQAQPSHSDYALKRTSFGAALFNGKEAIALDLYEQGMQTESVQDEYSYYKLLADGRISNVADFEEVDIGAKRHLVALTKDGKLASYVFPQGRWSSQVTAGDGIGFVTVAPNGEEGLFIVNARGEVFPLNPETLRRGPMVAQTWPATVVDFVKWQGQTLSVLSTGEVTDAQTKAVYAPLAGAKVQQMVTVPLYDAFDL